MRFVAEVEVEAVEEKGRSIAAVNVNKALRESLLPMFNKYYADGRQVRFRTRVILVKEVPEL